MRDKSSNRSSVHKVEQKQQNSRMCFICGLKNPFGLKASFYETDRGKLIATFKAGQQHQGYPGRLHGGISAAILDETIGRTINMGKDGEVWGVTIDFSIKYKRPIPLEAEIKAVTWLTEENKRSFKGEGKILNPDGSVAAYGYGRYLKLPIEKIADFDREENDWKVVQREDDHKYFEL